MNLGAQVKKLRKSLKLTQKQFAKRIPGAGRGRVDYTHINKIERGHSLPSVKMLTRMGETYGVPIGYFFLESSLIRIVTLRVREKVQSWAVDELVAFEEELKEKVEESVEKALTEIQR